VFREIKTSVAFEVVGCSFSHLSTSEIFVAEYLSLNICLAIAAKLIEVIKLRVWIAVGISCIGKQKIVVHLYLTFISA
jgi:membrane protein required for beta-lactamase induction